MNREELLSLEPKSFWKYFLKTSVPPWKPNFTSELLNIAKTTYQEIYGTETKANAIRGGLEPKVIGNKFPGMDMITIGSTVKNPRSPSERVHTLSVKKHYDYLKGLLERP